MTATLSTATGKTHRVSLVREVLDNYYVTDGDTARGAYGAKARTVCNRTYEGLVIPDGAARLTCEKCSAAAEETAPAAKVTVAAETARAAVTVTVPAARFSAVRIDGRWKVQDAATGETTTTASRAKAAERAAKLNAEAAPVLTTAEAARILTTPDLRKGAAEAKASEDRAREQAAARKTLDQMDLDELDEVRTAALEVVTLDGTETTVTVEETVSLAQIEADCAMEAEMDETCPPVSPAELAELVNAGRITFAEAAAKLPAAPAAPAEKAEPMRSLWVAAAFVPIILADAAPERATLVAKLDASTPNNRGGRTVRLTRAEAEELAAIGTEIENSVGGAGRMAHSARTMRDRLAALWA